MCLGSNRRACSSTHFSSGVAMDSYPARALILSEIAASRLFESDALEIGGRLEVFGEGHGHGILELEPDNIAAAAKERRLHFERDPVFPEAEGLLAASLLV